MNRQPHIVVVGSANVDLTTFTDLFPRPGETIFGREFHLGFGGKGANQAVAARLCGARVSMVARVGDDLFGPATIQNFTARGIDASHVWITPGVSSGVAPIFVDSSGQNRILVVKGANDRLSPADVDGASDLLRSADSIVLQLEIPIETVYHTLRFARAHGIRAILNPAPGQALDLAEVANADYVIPNETEAEALSGMPVRTLDDARNCAAQAAGRRSAAGHRDARRQRRAVRGSGWKPAHSAICGGTGGHHRSGRRFHREPGVLFRERLRGGARPSPAPISTRRFPRWRWARRSPSWRWSGSRRNGQGKGPSVARRKKCALSTFRGATF